MAATWQLKFVLFQPQTDLLASNLRTKLFYVYSEIVFSLTLHHIQHAHHVITITIIIIIPR